MTDDEHVLVERARAGDEEAFGMLIDGHRAKAVAVALRITRSAADAEDVAQQAFVRAWRALAKFRGESAFGTWLHQIVARRALDRASQLGERQARETDLEVAEVIQASVEERDVILIRRLEGLMQLLTAAQRAVVTLHYWDQMDVATIAAALAMPENTVKTHLSRARAALRKAWMESEVRR